MQNAYLELIYAQIKYFELAEVGFNWIDILLPSLLLHLFLAKFGEHAKQGRHSLLGDFVALDS